MSSRTVKPPMPPVLRLTVAAAVADVAMILVFAAVGRDAHQRGDVVTGVLLTAWPFLAGAGVAWAAARVWRDPMSVRRAGAPVWLGSVAGGMALRAVTGQTVVLPFVMVALLSLGLLLLGYRLLLVVLRRRRSPSVSGSASRVPGGKSGPV